MLPWALLSNFDWWAKLSPFQQLFVLSSLLMAGLLVFGIVAVRLANRWRRRQEVGTATANNQMSTFRELYERGEITREEYDRIRNKLGGRMRLEAAGKLPEAPIGDAPPALRPGPGTEVITQRGPETRAERGEVPDQATRNTPPASTEPPESAPPPT
jgi:uncharacterized membrane protein